MEQHTATTVIGPGTQVSGEVKSKGTVRIEGHVKGRVECEDTIIIHESGSVEADLEAKQVVISGTVEGNTYAHERLEVTSTGKIVGNITAPRLSIAEGVIFEGSCTMKAPGDVRAAKKDDAKPETKGEANGSKPHGQAAPATAAKS
jgi:cytoskeletal protein CcmA (bactofilin family)